MTETHPKESLGGPPRSGAGTSGGVVDETSGRTGVGLVLDRPQKDAVI